MPYRIVEFDGVPLPYLEPQQDHSPYASPPALATGLGTTYDVYGKARAPAIAHPITLSGVLWGEVEALVDEDGNDVTDENGNSITGAPNSAGDLRAQLNAIKEKVRRQGKLWRVWMDDESMREWKTARLVRLDVPQTVTDRDFMATIACTFESAQPFWHVETPTVINLNVNDGETQMFIVENGGEAISDAVFTALCTNGEISAISLTCEELNVGWIWNGTLTLGEMLVVDAGASEVAENAVDAYSGFTLTGSSRGFMTIERGMWFFTVSVMGGDAAINLTYYTQHE